MSDQASVLKQLFNLVRNTPRSKARVLGRRIDGGKSVVNHYLYGYEGVLFEKEDARSPRWSVIADGAYEEMMKRLNPTRGKGSGSKPLFPEARSALSIDDLDPITLCGSCNTPIKPNGMCRCS